MKKKFVLVSLALVIALGGLGVGYALWSDTVTISGTAETGELCWEITWGSGSQKEDNPDWNCFYDLNGGYKFQTGGPWPPGFPIDYPHPHPKNVATTNITYEFSLDPHWMSVNITNAYPFYYEHISFEVHNCGTIPLRYVKAEIYRDDTLIDTITYGDGSPYIYLDYDDNDDPDIELWWSNGYGLQLHPCGSHDISFEILILQDAKPESTYEFTIKLLAVQWDQYWDPEP